MTNENRTVAERLDALESHEIDPASAATKDAVKEALKEWLDDKFLMVGRWTVNGILAAGLVALVYAILIHQGWKHD
jgi:hypothetical protein